MKPTSLRLFYARSFSPRKTAWASALIIGAVLLSLLVQKSSLWPERIVCPPAPPNIQSSPNPPVARSSASPPSSTGSPAASGNQRSAYLDSSRPVQRSGDKESPLRRWQYGTHWGKESDPALAAFSIWAERYLAAGEPDRAAMVAQGLALAQERRAALLDLIVTDPREALTSSVPFAMRRQLPDIIAAQLEQRVSGKGDFLVLATVPQEGDAAARPAILRRALIGGERFTAHVFGERMNQRAMTDISLHGVAIDGHLALSESPVRLLEPGEPPAADAENAEPICSVSGLAAGSVDGTVVAEGVVVAASGDVVHWLCRGGHLEALENKVRAAEAGDVQGNGMAASYGTTGVRKILVMLLDFSDFPGDPVNRATAQTRLNDVTAFIRSNAFNRIEFTAKDVTPTLRMPRTGAAYAGNDDWYGLMMDARSAATEGGFNYTNYDFEVVVFANIGFGWSGLGYVGGKGCWVQGNFHPGVTAHELGHNFGNWHANSWVSSTVTGPDGTHIEYGNPFDVLGHVGGFPQNHYSANFKFLSGWLPSAFLHTVTTGGIYRIYAHDFGGNLDPARKYAIRIPVSILAGGETMDYWLDYRPGYNSTTANGAVLQWGNDLGTQSASRLLDTQPGTLGNMGDSPLIVGQTFTDATRALSITTLAKGGSGTDTYLDIRMAFGSSPSVTLNEALDRPRAVWSSGGDQPWTGQAAVTHDGTDAAASGADSHNQLSWMETSVNGPGILSFWWKVSSKAYYDYLSVLSDGVLVDEISGERDWQQRILAVPAGTHTFRWQYSKHGSPSSGGDRGWVDQISFTPPNDLFANRIGVSGTSAIANGSNVEATSEMGEPLHAGITGSKSVWWSWTAPATGPVTMTTSGSSFSTLLDVYTGSSVAGLSRVAGNDGDVGPNRAVNFPAIAGTTYQIAVDGYCGAMGAVTLRIDPATRLRMAAVQRLADGTCRIWIANADGTPIDPTRISRISVLASSSVAQLVEGSTQLTGTLRASGSMLWIDDPDARHLPMRFYRASEKL